jgi:predicted O-methyltransferase YrrM
MFKRFRKHYLIAGRRLNQKNELNRISQYKNSSLQIILDAFLQVKNSKYSEVDKKAFHRCENYRKKLLQDNTVISYELFDSDKTAIVKDICKNAASGKKWCEFLYYLCRNSVSPTVLEIGTNLGISGCYVIEAIKDKPESHFTTLEGLQKLCEISAQQFTSLAPASKFDIIQGLFDTTFPALLEEPVSFNLIFIDGNHQKQPTLKYFKELKSRINTPMIFVFDDINWSKGMNDAWNEIKNDDQVNFTIDLYKQGVVVVDKKESAKNIGFSLHLDY